MGGLMSQACIATKDAATAQDSFHAAFQLHEELFVRNHQSRLPSTPSAEAGLCPLIITLTPSQKVRVVHGVSIVQPAVGQHHPVGDQTLALMDDVFEIRRSAAITAH
jgi:hypothetical protein